MAKYVLVRFIICYSDPAFSGSNLMELGYFTLIRHSPWAGRSGARLTSPSRASFTLSVEYFPFPISVSIPLVFRICCFRKPVASHSITIVSSMRSTSQRTTSLTALRSAGCPMDKGLKSWIPTKCWAASAILAVSKLSLTHKWVWRRNGDSVFRFTILYWYVRLKAHLRALKFALTQCASSTLISFGRWKFSAGGNLTQGCLDVVIKSTTCPFA